MTPVTTKIWTGAEKVMRAAPPPMPTRAATQAAKQPPDIPFLKAAAKLNQQEAEAHPQKHVHAWERPRQRVESIDDIVRAVQEHSYALIPPALVLLFISISFLLRARKRGKYDTSLLRARKRGKYDTSDDENLDRR